MGSSRMKKSKRNIESKEIKATSNTPVSVVGKSDDNSVIVVSADYAARVNSLRNRMAINQVTMAKRLGVAKMDISRWERSLAKPTAVQWARFTALEMLFNSKGNASKKKYGLPEVKIVSGMAKKESSLASGGSASSDSDSVVTITSASSVKSNKDKIAEFPEDWPSAEVSSAEIAGISSMVSSGHEKKERSGKNKAKKDLILFFRRKFGYSQKNLASILGVTGPTVCQWESGLYCPTAERWAQLKKFAMETHGFNIESCKTSTSKVANDVSESISEASVNYNVINDRFVPYDFSRQVKSFLSRTIVGSKKSDINYEFVAKKVGVSEETIVGWESGSIVPVKSEWRKFCKMRREVNRRSINRKIKSSESDGKSADKPSNESFTLFQLLQMLSDISVKEIQKLSAKKRIAFFDLISD